MRTFAKDIANSSALYKDCFLAFVYYKLCSS